MKVVRGPNIQPFPKNTKVPKEIKGGALIKVEDNITTDHIMPSNAKLLPFRSNVPYLADYCLTPCDPEFPARARGEQAALYHRRAELRAGLQPRACSTGSPAAWRKGCHRKILRAYPHGKPD